MHPIDKNRGLTLERLRSIYDYDPRTGDFTYKIQRSQMFPGMKAGTIRKDGYIDIQIDGHLYLAHRLAWFHYFGTWPVKRVDHIKGKKNNIRNLREATSQQNMFNFNGHARKALPKGVFLCRDGAYETCIRYKSQSIYLGRYKTVREAADMYQAAALIIHKDYAYAKPALGNEVLNRAWSILDHKTSGGHKKWQRI